MIMFRCVSLDSSGVHEKRFQLIETPAEELAQSSGEG